MFMSGIIMPKLAFRLLAYLEVLNTGVLGTRNFSKLFAEHKPLMGIGHMGTIIMVIRTYTALQ
jgi:hypothetical protein